MLSILLCSAFAYLSSAQISADFTTTSTEACDALQTTLFDQSTSVASIIDWTWDLAGNSSQEQNPGVLFTEPGTYTICLTVTDVNGLTDTHCKTDYISVYPAPIADFVVDNAEGCVPVAVTFSDNSSSGNGDIVSWLWGVGGSAGVVNQTMAADFTSTYAIQGNYTASLTVVDERGCTATTSKSNAIVASSLVEPQVDIELVPTCDLPWEVTFTNTNADPLVNYQWDFGNGETYSGAQPPSIIYSEIGQYQITIDMTSGDCQQTIVLDQEINTLSTAAFEYSPDVVCQHNAVEFTDVSLTEADAVVWQFGDGTSSTEPNPTHIYGSPGCFDVTLVRTSGTCQDTVVVSCVQVLEQPSVSFEVTNQFDCNVPTEVLLHTETDAAGSFGWAFFYPDGTVSVHDTNDVRIDIPDHGLYKAAMTFTSAQGCVTQIDSIAIDIAPFEVNLPVEGPSGCAPLTFTLSDSISSQVGIDSWTWSIGDGLYTATGSNPTFTIPDTGRYDILLIAENEYGCIDTIEIDDYIKVGNSPEVNFSADPLIGCSNDPKKFTNLSVGASDEWTWVLGENRVIGEENPTFYFDHPGIYDITLIASHNGCVDSLTIPEYITVLAPSSVFTINYNCDDPYTTNIVNNSIGADSLGWTLYLTETDSIVSADSLFGEYTFPDRGKYLIKHVAKNYDTGCITERTDTIRISDPIASYEVDTLRGCAPFEVKLNNTSQDAISFEFVSDDAVIDSVFNPEPSITFYEGGIIESPLLIITDIHECKDSFQLVDSVIVNKLVADIAFEAVICVPDVVELTDQSSDVLGTPVKWDWKIEPGGFESDQQNTEIYIDEVGLYDITFKVEDDWGCMDSLLLPMSINAVEIIPDFTFDSLGCSWAPFQFKSLGDNGNVATYAWDFGDGNTSSIANPGHIYDAEGSYTVCLTMTDARGCGKTICKEDIVHIIDPAAQFVGDPLTATCPPLLSVFENQSTDASDYLWDFGDASGASVSDSPSHVYTKPGRFDVMLIAQSTPVCRDTLVLEEYVIVDGPNGQFTADVAETCLPVDVKLNATSDDYYTYVWDLGNGILDSVDGIVIADTITYTYNLPGTYTPKLIITDSTGCTRSFAGAQIKLDMVELDFAVTPEPICGPPLAVDLQNLSAGTTDDVDFLWNITGPDDYSSTDENPSFDIQQSGKYEVSLIASYGNCIDTVTVADFMEIADIPDVSFEILADQLCDDVNVQFFNTSSVTYGEFIEWSWDFGDGNTSNEESPTHQYDGVESQTIILRGLTDKGCEAEYTLDLNVLPSTVALVGEDETICIGDRIKLEGELINLQEGGSWYWEPHPALECTNCLPAYANPTSTTDFVLVGVHPNGCESRDTISVTVIQTPGPELALVADSIVCSDLPTVIDVVNFQVQYTYRWDTSIPGLDCYLNCDEVTVSPTEKSTYYVTVYNQYGCYKEDSITIDVESEIDDFLIDTTAICFENSTELEVIGANNATWTNSPTLSCTDCQLAVATPEEDQTYYVTAISDLGCVYQDSVRVEVIPEGTISVGPDQEVCHGEEVTLTAQGAGTPLWTSNGTVIDSNNLVSITIPDSSSVYTLQMSYYECVQRDSFYATVYDKAEIFASGDTICVGEMATLVADGRVDQYRWYGDHDDFEGPSISIEPDTTTSYMVIGDYRTCASDTAFVDATVHPKVDYHLEEGFYSIHLNDPVHLDPEFDSLRQYNYQWVPEEGLDCADCPDPTISDITQSMDYIVVITDDETGCVADQEISVRFNNECTDMVFHLPNVFSPNGDGQNDGFRVQTENPDEFISLQVFDRYGSLLYTSSDIEEEWNGQYNGQFVVPGVYVYRVKLICPYNQEEYNIYGDVTVIR